MLENATVAVPQTAFDSISEMRRRVLESQAMYNASAADTKEKKKTYDAARETFEREFDRLIARTNGEDLPLFNQSDALNAAVDKPGVKQLVERLLTEANVEVNLLIAAGYTDDERKQVTDWLDKCAALREANQLILDGNKENPEQAVLHELPDPPAFLTPQDVAEETDADLEALCEGLKDHGVELLPLRAQVLYTLADRHVIRAWLKACEVIKAEKGEAVTMDDFPPAPACILGHRDNKETTEAAAGGARPEGVLDAEADQDDQNEAGDPDEHGAEAE